jgi:hypothetical protein
VQAAADAAAALPGALKYALTPTGARLGTGG